MSSASQQYRCGWNRCGHLFGSEIDMNMHVLMNHMILLDHGTYTVTRRAPGRKRPAKQIEPSPEPSNITVRTPVAVRENPAKPPPPPKQKSIPPTTSASTSDPSLEAALQFLPRPNFTVKEEKVDLENVYEFDMEKGDQQSGEQNAQETNDNSVFQQESIAPQLIDTLDDIMERLRPMKQLGFIRPTRTVYCIICLKYTKSIQYCSWKHTPAEERIAEMWNRRYDSEKTTGKTQLMKELVEIKSWIQNGEESAQSTEEPVV